MKVLQAAIVTLVLTFAFSCGAVRNDNKKKDFEKFPKEITLQKFDYVKLKEITPDGLLLLDDSILLVRDKKKTDGFHFQSYNIVQKKPITRLLPSGGQQGKVMGFMSYGLQGSYLWGHDIIKDKVFFTNLNTLGRNEIADINVKEINFPTFFYWLSIPNDSTILATGNYYDTLYPNAKVAKVNPIKGMVERVVLQYPATSDGKAYPREKKMANESFLFANPAGDKCVLANRYADKIEIVNVKTNLSKIVSGPEGYEPDMMVAKGNDGINLSATNDKTRYGFVRGKVTNKYIYLLYSGDNAETIHLNYGRYIYVYDWEGNPIKKLIFKDYMLDFVVTANDELLYAYNPKTNFIIKANIRTNE